MRRTIDGRTYITEFETITELVHFIKTNEYQEAFVRNNRHDSTNTESYFVSNAKTKDYEEAEDLLLHGWEHGTIEIKNKVEAKANGVELKQKTVYDVAGFQCSVPRYLQGIPTNMINKKSVPQKNKVITINKIASYGWVTRPNVIIDESVKVLQLINRLEKQGYRVNLNVIFGTKGNYASIIKLKIKNSSQRLNIKQVAFPLVHPSMLRRIIFAVWERNEENNFDSFVNHGYGRIIRYEELKQNINKGEYLIPNVISENEILEVEKYKVG